MTTGERISNTLVGAGIGLCIGGITVATMGVGSYFIVGSATSVVGILGGSSLQTFAIGAIAYDVSLVFLSPFSNSELEPIESPI